ncbi:HAD family hydrolase [Reichenbachiella ulvae]|uniref:Haloacid dehalogenase-like hydrolase n=1 Tax=Reichenbachiella ulvae TaxID=2980104 RepID=A0ABT3D0W4_9BACT|nr:HAD family hydrolase [Reichenbachiella ulvae]MCV9389469.1 haloacid dehalogenase-like hydrolase [Reichenbachiella ulvae]
MKKTLALFDFDGTITSKDTLFEIAKFSTSKTLYWVKILSLLPIFFLMKIGIIPKSKGKETFLWVFFHGLNEETFNALCFEFCLEKLPMLLRPKAINKISELQKKNTDIYIVSASPQNWIIPWAKQLNINVLSTQLDFSNSSFTGKIKNENVNYEEKVKIIQRNIDLSQYNEILAFGDTKGDIPMLNLASSSHFRPFE